ncbi:hypothetical protein PHSC3_000232 [Chlamydiales bacterium STE3]|nr:hypothetical protein PHSC3_000232 [Chlamydiales bacterium STE3]
MKINFNYRAVYNFNKEMSIEKRSKLKELFLETITRPFKVVLFPAASFLSFKFVNKKRIAKAREELKLVGGKALKLQTPNRIAIDAMYISAEEVRNKILSYFEILKDHNNDSYYLKPMKSLDKGHETFIEALESMGLKMHEGKILLEASSIASQTESDLEERPVTLICPGRDMSFPAYKRVALSYLLRGIDVMLFDYPGVGRSEGSPTDYNTKLSAETCYQYIASEIGIDNNKIIVHGHSLGGGIATDLAARRKGTTLFLDRSFSSFVQAAIDKYPRFEAIIKRILPKIANFNNCENLKRVEGHIAIAQGLEDKVINETHSKVNYEVLENKSGRVLQKIQAPVGHNGNIIDKASEAFDEFLKNANLIRGLFSELRTN